MTPTVVQALGVQKNGNNSATISFSESTSKGDVLVLGAGGVGCGSLSPHIISVTDSQQNTWTRQVNASVGQVDSEIWLSTAGASAPESILVGFSSAPDCPSNTALVAYELSGTSALEPITSTGQATSGSSGSVSPLQVYNQGITIGYINTSGCPTFEAGSGYNLAFSICQGNSEYSTTTAGTTIVPIAISQQVEWVEVAISLQALVVT